MLKLFSGGNRLKLGGQYTIHKLHILLCKHHSLHSLDQHCQHGGQEVSEHQISTCYRSLNRISAPPFKEIMTGRRNDGQTIL